MTVKIAVMTEMALGPNFVQVTTWIFLCISWKINIIC